FGGGWGGGWGGGSPASTSALNFATPTPPPPHKGEGTREPGTAHETTARHWAGAFRRHRRHRHERHRRGDAEPRLYGAGLRSVRERQRQAFARQGRENRNRTCGREFDRRPRRRRVVGDQN